VPADVPTLLDALAGAALPVIADGRCPVASVLLALDFIRPAHSNRKGRRTIDAARRSLGHSMGSLWLGERPWVDDVPVNLRLQNARLSQERADSRAPNTLEASSFVAYQALLTDGAATTWLDHLVFYLVARYYGVGVVIVVPAEATVPLYCRVVGAPREKYIVLLHRQKHYECVRWDDRTLFLSEHPLIARLVELSRTHPPRECKETDLETVRLDQLDAANAAIRAAELVGAAAAAAAVSPRRAPAAAAAQPPPAPEVHTFDMGTKFGYRPLPLSIANEPGWIVDGTAIHARVRVLDTLGGGRCSIAAPLRARGLITTAAADDYNIDAVAVARAELAVYAECNYSPQRWVDDVPWRFRTAESSPTASSYEQMRKEVVHGDSTTCLSPSSFFILSDKLNISVFLIVQPQGDSFDAEFYHIRSPAATGTDAMVLLSTVQHYETCEWLDDDSMRRVRICKQGSLMYRAMETLCADYITRCGGKEGQASLLGEDYERLQLEQRHGQGPEADPTTAAPTRVLRARSSVNYSEQPVAGLQWPDEPRPRRKKDARPQSSPDIGRPSPVKGASQSSKKSPRPSTADNSRAAQTARVRPVASAGAIPHSGNAAPGSTRPMTPRQVAAHSQLYDFISFPNVAQWIAINIVAWNAYRVASQGDDRAAQARALEDILMLPQRVLTRTSRGAGDGQRLTSKIRARCRDVGADLRERYGCMPPRDNNVQLDIVTKQLSTKVRATSSTATTDDEHDSDAETVQPASPPEENIEGEDAAVEDDYSSAWTHSSPFAADPDRQAAKRAQHHVRHGHLSKAAQALYSVTELADLRQAENQQIMRDLHPSLPEGSVLPSLPQHAPEMILEDDAVMHALLRRSNNGAASGPSGWGGNLLSTLVESDICRAGIIALLKDIINGNLPDSARQLLLASRAIGLGKPDNGIRPIAIGELFYRLAGVIAVRKIAVTAGKLLAPHQFGVGVANGAERILHSLQRSLTDKHAKLALLKLDISNAFNSCDRARVLRQLYDTPELSSLYRLADFGYSTPSELLLQGCDGQSIPSSNGVRQGDPLSCC